MKELALTILILLTPLPAQAYEWGIGTDLGFYRALFIPIKMNDGLRIEPMFTGTSTPSSSSNTIGVGIYRILPIRNNVQTYYGARFSRQSSASEVVNWIIPTLGAEYFFSKQFAIGVDATVQYGQYASGSNNGPSRIETYLGTMLRFYM